MSETGVDLATGRRETVRCRLERTTFAREVDPFESLHEPHNPQVGQDGLPLAHPVDAAVGRFVHRPLLRTPLLDTQCSAADAMARLFEEVSRASVKVLVVDVHEPEYRLPEDEMV